MFKTLNIRESVEKEVMKFGNGSIVYTPKKWLGKKVIVVLEEKPVDAKAEVMELLKPHLSSIEGVFLYGSFAREEQDDESDIDVLVIADRKIRLRKNGRVDFTVMTRNEFSGAIKADSTLFLHQIMNEAKPILNEALLRELKKDEARPDFGIFLNGTLGAFRRTKELLEASQGKELLDSNTAIYSLVLRLKGLFLAQGYIKKQAFSNKGFMRFITSHGFKGCEVEKFFEAYRAERDERKTKVRIALSDAERLFEAAKIEFLKTEEAVKNGQKQIPERHRVS